MRRASPSGNATVSSLPLARLLDDEAEHRRMARPVNPFGDGRASERIVAMLLDEPVEPFRVAAT